MTKAIFCRDTRLTDAYAYGFSVCLFASVIKMSKLIFATLGSALLPTCDVCFQKFNHVFPLKFSVVSPMSIHGPYATS